MSATETAQVGQAQAGQRVDQAAVDLFPGYSRSQLSRWIVEGLLRVDGLAVKPKTRVLGGEQLELNAGERATENWHVPQELAFDVVYEDDWVLVLDKPAGLVVHPGAGNPDGTLVNGLLARRPSLAALPRAGLVHRLDKDTSGLMVVAACLEAHTALVRALQDRAVERRYYAIAEGRLSGGLTIDRPLGRDSADRRRRKVLLGGKPAVTHVRLRERFRAHTAISASLETGRTHQIRVHLASCGHPLVGDRVYGARGILPKQASSATVAQLRGFSRQALHAEHLAFEHPGRGERLSFTAPVPLDLAALADALRADQAAADD